MALSQVKKIVLRKGHRVAERTQNIKVSELGTK